MKMLKAALNGIATVFAQMAEAMETKAGLAAQVKTLETENQKLKAESTGAKGTTWAKKKKKKPFRRKYSQMKNLTSGKKAQLLDEQDKSGLSVSQFCREKGLSNSTFYYWQRARAAARGARLFDASPYQPDSRSRSNQLPKGE
jgi:transposase-like protein